MNTWWLIKCLRPWWSCGNLHAVIRLLSFGLLKIAEPQNPNWLSSLRRQLLIYMGNLTHRISGDCKVSHQWIQEFPEKFIIENMTNQMINQKKWVIKWTSDHHGKLDKMEDDWSMIDYEEWLFSRLYEYSESLLKLEWWCQKCRKYSKVNLMWWWWCCKPILMSISF